MYQYVLLFKHDDGKNFTFSKQHWFSEDSDERAKQVANKWLRDYVEPDARKLYSLARSVKLS